MFLRHRKPDVSIMQPQTMLELLRASKPSPLNPNPKPCNFGAGNPMTLEFRILQFGSSGFRGSGVQGSAIRVQRLWGLKGPS